MDTVPATLDELSEDQADDFIMRVRDARMRVVRELEDAKRVAKEVKEAKLHEKLVKQCDILTRELERLDKTLAKCEQRVNNIRVLRLEGEVL